MNPYIKAAELCNKAQHHWHNGWFACNAVHFSGGDAKKFATMFDPRRMVRIAEAWGDRWADNDRDRKACRVLALCFAAAMYETGDL